jgi:hypothetical protein
LVIATPDPATLPETATWYLETTLPRAEADPAEIVRLYGLRHWVEQAYKQVKHSLGWSQYQVRSDAAMRRHWALVQGAFAFWWWAERYAPMAEQDDAGEPLGERGGKGAGPRSGVGPAVALLAGGATAGARLIGARVLPLALLDGMVRPADTTRLARSVGLAAPRPPAQPR